MAGTRRLLLPLAPRPLATRILCALLMLPAVWVTAAALSLFEVAAREGGWLPSTGAFIVPLLPLTTGLGIGRRWWQRAAVVLALALALGTWIYQTSPPVPERLAGVARGVGVPTDWATVNEQVGGSTWGLFGDFPRYDAVHATPEAAQEAMASYTALLAADGWERYDPQLEGQSPTGVLKTYWRRDRWLLSVSVQPSDNARTDGNLSPQTMTEVNVHVGYS